MRKPLPFITAVLVLAGTTGGLVSMPKSNPLPRWDESLLVTTEEMRQLLSQLPRRPWRWSPHPRRLRHGSRAERLSR